MGVRRALASCLSSYFISDLLPVHHDGQLRIERLWSLFNATRTPLIKDRKERRKQKPPLSQKLVSMFLWFFIVDICLLRHRNRNRIPRMLDQASRSIRGTLLCHFLLRWFLQLWWPQQILRKRSKEQIPIRHCRSVVAIYTQSIFITKTSTLLQNILCWME